MARQRKVKKAKRNRKRGIRIKTRVILTALLFLAAVALLFLGTYKLQLNLVPIYTLFEIIGIITVIYIVNKRGNPSYKIAWIIIILGLPVFGLALYLLWGGGRIFPHLKKRYFACTEHYMKYLKHDRSIEQLLSYDNASLARQAAFLKEESGFPLYKDTTIDYLAPGEVFFPKLLDELQKAEKYVFIEYFILAEGKMWSEIYKILEEKAAAGVEIKIIFDDFGSIKRQQPQFITKLKKAGIEVAVFNKIKPSLNIFLNNRNHRKIVIIDGNVAFTGGINIADEYINKFERFGYWMDCCVMVKGSAVDSFLVMFCFMWEYTTGNQILMSKHLLSKPYPSDGYAVPYCDGPMDNKEPAEGIYLQILQTSHRYVDIATPYLILDNSMTSAIILAAKSGVKIRIITPSIPDKSYVHPVTQFYYDELLEAGVRIFEYTPGFIHSKIFVSDDSCATVGTVNMDYRSFVFHFECGVWFTHKSTIKNIRSHFESMLKESTEIKLDTWRKRNIFLKLKQWILHLFSPLM